MSEFTKLGGYLIEGQPEVAHDNTLSGNGLEGSPLGLSEQVSEANDLVHSNSGTWDGVSAKLDTTAFSDVSGSFLTAVPEGYATTADLTAYQTTADMTAYQSAGDYLSANALDDVSGDWNRISALSGYSANGWNVKLRSRATIWAGSDVMTAKGVPNFTGYLTVSSYPNWVSISDGSIYLYKTNRSDSAQVIRPDTIFKWNNYASGKLDATATANFYTTANESGFISGLPDETATANFYTTANESGFISEVPAGTMNESAFGYDASDNITAYNGSAIGGGSAPIYGYTDNGLISAIDSSGLYASSGSASHLRATGTMGNNITQSDGSNTFLYMPGLSPWTTADVATGIFSPLQYATGACLAMDAGYFKAYFKGNEWFVSNRGIGQALRGEVHASRGVHISGATTAGYGFDLNIKAVSGINSTGFWKYGHAEDAALRAVSSCDMHESAFSYDASDNITAYNGSAFKAGDEFPQSATEAIETVTANSGAWGGSALPISAGPGIKVNLVDNTLVFSNDETVLFETTALDVSAISLSEPLSSFERFRLYPYQAGAGYYDYGEFDYNTVRELATGNNIKLLYSRGIGGNNPFQFLIGEYELSNDRKSITCISGYRRWFPMSNGAGGYDSNNTYIRKIVGINRIAGGN